MVPWRKKNPPSILDPLALRAINGSFCPGSLGRKSPLLEFFFFFFSPPWITVNKDIYEALVEVVQFSSSKDTHFIETPSFFCEVGQNISCGYYKSKAAETLEKWARCLL